MSRFEFNIVLVSIMLAFAATELATVWGRALRQERPRVPGPFALLSIWLFLSLVLHWFGLWSYREVAFDTPLQSLAVLLPSLVLALLTRLLNPGESGDLGEHYERVRSRALPLAGLFLVLSAVSDAFLPGVLEAPPTAFFLVSGASLALLGVTANGLLHLLVLGLNTAAAVVVFAVAQS